MSMTDYEITLTRTYHDGPNTVSVEISDTERAWHMRLVVNGKPSPWYGSKYDLICWRGYAWASYYWGDPAYDDGQPANTGQSTMPPIDRPFRITALDEVKA